MGGGGPVLHRRPQPGVDHGAAHRAHGASPRAADGAAADAESRSLQQLWPVSGYGRAGDQSGLCGLSVFGPEMVDGEQPRGGRRVREVDPTRPDR